MVKLLKYLKSYLPLIIIIIVLVAGQAISQLMLPDMMSRIINNGIYLDYVEMTPYKAARDENGNVIYMSHNGTEIEIYETKIPMPDNSTIVLATDSAGNYIINPETGAPVPEIDTDTGMPKFATIDESDPDYNLFKVKSSNRLLPKINITSGQIVYKLDESGKTLQTSDINYILRIGGLMLLLTFLVSVAAITVSYLASKVAMGFGGILRSKIFNKVESFSIKEFDKFGNASLTTRSTNDVTQIQNVLVMALRIMVMSPIMFGGAMIMAYRKSSNMTAVLAITIPLIILSIIVVAAITIPLFKKMQKRMDKLTLVSRENLTGVRVIRAFNQEARENKRFNEANLDVTKIAVKVNRCLVVLMPLITIIMSFTVIGITWFASKAAANGNASNIGNMMAVIQYAMQIMFSLIMLTVIFVLIPRASASGERIREVLDEPISIEDSKNATPYENLNGLIEFKNVSYAFSENAEKKALDNITFTAEPGKVTAIIGSTGSGKSTLINLIPRFYDTTEGEILIDGVEIKDIKIDTLRGMIGFVPQKASLFTGTIAENIRYGKLDATDEEVKRAAKIAQATHFIEKYEDSYDHEVSQGGANFSGGQKQRLAIARAIVRDPEIYVFDDSFSALDFKTDAKLRQALKKEIVGKTIIIIAQRIGTIMDADNIIVLNEGKIAGCGTHQELLKTCKVYKEIALSQLSEEEL